MNSSFLSTLGVKLYTSGKTGQIEKAIKYFLKAVEIDANSTALHYLCENDIKSTDDTVDIISIVSRNLKYLPVSTRLDLLHILHPKYPLDTHVMYQDLLLLQLSPQMKHYVLEVLCRKPYPTNTELNIRLQFLKSMLDISVTDRTICKYIITRQYLSTTDPVTPPGINLDNHFKTLDHKYTSPRIVTTRNKIYVGFITSNLDKAGMTLFSYDIINSLDPEKFVTIVYYDDSDESMQVQPNKTNNHVSWCSIYKKHTKIVYQQIHTKHKIDILIDLTSFRSPDIIRIMALRPAKVQINYTHINIPLECYTHTLTDKYTNANANANANANTQVITFKGVNQLFHLGIPPIDRDFQMSTLIQDHTRTLVGIVNSQMQVSLKCVLVYNAISAKYKHVTYIVKGYHIPNLKNALYITDTAKSLTEYYKLFNTIDYVIDTFPFSGNNTTAAALYMGCPVLSFYNPHSLQTSNTSSAMNFNCGLDKYVFKSPRSILKFKFNQFRDNHGRKCVHKAFLKSMNASKFMKEFEEILLSTT